MRKWGIVVTLVYAALVIGLALPGILLVCDPHQTWQSMAPTLREGYSQWSFWLYAGALVASQATLLFLSVDTSHKRLKPRSHILLSGAVTTLLIALLTLCVIWSLGLAIRGEKFLERVADNVLYLLGFWAALWAVWGGIFYLYLRDASVPVTRLTTWLLRGSVLELLVAVPCHVIVRRRGDCSAPAVTGFGIASGIAIMLLSFGPGVLLLYKKRLDAYADRSSPAAKGRGAGAED